MPVLVCRDRVEYAAAIVDREELSARLGHFFMPVIGSDDEDTPYEPSSSLSALAGLSDRELFERCAHSGARDRGVCAYVTGDAGGWLCAAAFAAFSDRRLVPLDVDRRPEPARSITVVVSSEVLTARGTDWVQERVRALFPGRPPLGILSAHDERELSRFVARSVRRMPKPRGVAEVTWMPEAKPYGFDDAGVAQVPEMRAMPDRNPEAQILVFRGHSREYCGQSGRLCSRAVWSDEKLACVRGLECVADVFARTPTRDIRSDIVFLDGCFGGRFPGSVEPNQNLTTQLIEAGTSAVFTSAGRYYEDRFTPLLSVRLMASGWSFGRVARAVNRVLAQRYGTLDFVLLFGDPEGVPFSDCEPLPELEARVENGEVSFHVETPIASDPQIFLVRSSAFGDGPHSCRRHPGGMSAVLLRLDDEHAVMIVLGGRGAAGEIVFGRRPPVDLGVLSAASKLVERLVLLPTAKDAALDERVSALGEMLHARGTVATMARLGTTSMLENDQLSRYERSVAEAAADLAVRHARACRAAIAYGGWLESFYEELGQMDLLPETFGSATCPNCSLPLLSCNYRVFVAARTDDRERLECERCGVICDVLAGSRLIWLEAPTETRLGASFEARVRGTNGSDLPVYLGAEAFVAYVDPAKWETRVVSCPSRVGPGESFTVTFECRVDPSARAHVYELRALLSMNGTLALANRRVVYRRG
jgi:hypothetical protein